MILTSACFESHFCAAVSGPELQAIKHGQQEGFFTLPGGSLFTQVVSFSGEKHSTHGFYEHVWRHQLGPYGKLMGPALLLKKAGSTGPTQHQEPLGRLFSSTFA